MDGEPKLNKREFLLGATALAANTVLSSVKAESLERKHEQPFGLDHIPDTNSANARMWSELKGAIHKDVSEYAEGATPAAKQMERIVKNAQIRSGLNVIKNLKAVLQSSVRQQTIAEERRGSIKDWHAPLDAFRNKNDCKGFAVLNYFGLGALRIPDKDRQILIVRDNVPHMRWNPDTQKEQEMFEHHAIAAVRLHDEWYILDNLLDTVVTDKDFFVLRKKDWVPIAAFNEEGAWRVEEKPRNLAEK